MEELAHAEKRQRAWAVRSASGNRVISFVNDFVEFVGEFSGIIEIMKGVDQGYGGAAYTALSCLLAVAVNTKRKDDLVAGAIANLRAEYSRMVLISEIYPTPAMKTYITTLYSLGIEFVQEATLYYSQPTWRRMWDAIVRPPFLLNRMVTEISVAVTQIEKESVTNLHQSVRLLQTKCDQLSRDVGHVQGDIDEIHTNSAKERLARLQKELSHYLIQRDRTTEEYAKLLAGSFDRPPGLVRSSAEMLMSQKAYVTWKNSRTNCMLVLNGRTAADQTSCCWLSPAAIEVASVLKREARASANTDTNTNTTPSSRRVAVVELYCQKTDFMRDRDQARPPDAVVSLLLQLLESDLTILRDEARFDSLRQRLCGLRAAGGAQKELDQACHVLAEVLAHFDLVYVVLDRADRIRGDFVREMLMKVMLGRQNGAMVRALCVASRNQPGTVDKIESLEYDTDEKNFLTLRMDQSGS